MLSILLYEIELVLLPGSNSNLNRSCLQLSISWQKKELHIKYSEVKVNIGKTFGLFTVHCKLIYRGSSGVLHGLLGIFI